MSTGYTSRAHLLRCWWAASIIWVFGDTSRARLLRCWRAGVLLFLPIAQKRPLLGPLLATVWPFVQQKKYFRNWTILLSILFIKMSNHFCLSLITGLLVHVSCQGCWGLENYCSSHLPTPHQGHFVLPYQNSRPQWQTIRKKCSKKPTWRSESPQPIQ